MIVIDEPSQASPGEQAEWWARCMGARIQDGYLIVIESRTHDADLLGHILDSDPWPMLELNPFK